jgi:hypothetical protein
MRPLPVIQVCVTDRLISCGFAGWSVLIPCVAPCCRLASAVQHQSDRVTYTMVECLAAAQHAVICTVLARLELAHRRVCFFHVSAVLFYTLLRGPNGYGATLAPPPELAPPGGGGHMSRLSHDTLYS